MADYLAAFKKQLTGTACGPYNCNMGAAAMFADQSTIGIVHKTADDLRKLSTPDEDCKDPNHADDGTTIQEAANGLARLGVHSTVYDRYDSFEFDDLLTSLKGLRSAIAHGDYDQIPSSLKGDKNFLGIHSVFFAGLAQGGIRVGDSLNDGRHTNTPKGYIVWPLEVAKHYTEKFSGHHITVAIMDVKHLTARVKVANVRQGPSTLTPIIEHLTPGHELRYGGIVIGHAVGHDRRWYKVWVPSKGRVGYMHASVVKPS